VLCCAIVALSLSANVSAETLDERARTFLEALSADERDDATWPFTDEERLDIHYAPIGLDGLRHGDLGKDVQELGDDILRAAMSERGYEKVRSIRLLERDIRERESMFLRPFGLRDPGRYFWAFFGEPSDSAPWSFRHEGHLLSINVNAVPGKPASTTPLFLGAQPRIVPAGMPSEGVATLGEEERIARELYASLDAEQSALATFPYAKGRGNMVGQVAIIPTPQPIGLARASMNDAQRALVDLMLDHFAGLWNDEIARARRADISAARDGLHFAHVESSEPANAFYTRLSGLGLLLEIDNTEGGDHVHAVWHRPGGDFARDLLADHLAQDHGITLARH
jgi:hypothetical protein